MLEETPMLPHLKSGDELVIATHNAGKLREFRDLFEPFGIGISSAGELDVPEPEETGDTFEDNAQLKAVITAFATGRMALADDSGLAVEALGGDPGIYSARWAGESRDFNFAMKRVEEELQAKGAITPVQRRASFVCVLCLANPMGSVHFFRGEAPGTLIWPPRGTKGFGYDPMFVPEGYELTFGEMDSAQKHEISHRAKAFAAFRAEAILG
jgi:XTP/dITP diphosphohydrolase